MVRVTTISLLTVGVLLCFQSGLTVVNADIVQIGDSVANSDTNRAYADLWLRDKGIIPVWVGDHGGGRATFARGGLTYQGMLNGTDIATGLKSIVDDYSEPDVLYILGGYNNVAFEEDDSDMSTSISALGDILDLAELEWPSVEIYVSNITTFSETGSWAHKRTNVTTLNQLIALEVMNRDRAYLVDNFSVIGESDLQTDGLHLNRDGQIKIGNNFASTFYLNSVPEPNLSVFMLAALLGRCLVRTRRS